MMTPTLTNSSRSTRGTTRMAAKSYAGTQSLLNKKRSVGEPRGQIGYVAVAAIRRYPLIGNLADNLNKQFFVQARTHLPVDRRNLTRPAQQHMMTNRAERIQRLLADIAPVVMKVETGAMIDEVQRLMPPEQVRVARGAIHVGDEGIEPDRFGCNARVHGLFHGAVEHDRSRQIIERQIETGTRQHEFPDLPIRLGASQIGVHVDQHNFRDPHSQRAPDLA